MCVFVCIKISGSPRTVCKKQCIKQCDYFLDLGSTLSLHCVYQQKFVQEIFSTLLIFISNKSSKLMVRMKKIKSCHFIISEGKSHSTFILIFSSCCFQDKGLKPGYSPTSFRRAQWKFSSVYYFRIKHFAIYKLDKEL